MTDSGIARPSALAVFKLITKRNRVGCSNGRSAGFAPIRSEEHTPELQSPYRISYARFFFNDTATTEIYTLSLHDALPICALAVFKLITKRNRVGCSNGRSAGFAPI